MVRLTFESGTVVSFRLAGATCPEPEQIVEKITDDLELTGRILYLSDSGDRKDDYAVIEVDGIVSPIIVPTERISKVATAHIDGSTTRQRA